MRKHTPGPWEVRAAATYRAEITANGIPLARVTVPQNGHATTTERHATADANAQLLAAAPELYEAALKAFANLDAALRGRRPVHGDFAVAKELRDALAKAVSP